MEIAPLASAIGPFLIVLALIVLVYAIASHFVSDQTLFDFTLLPAGDPRKLTYLVQPAPSDEPIPFPSVFDEPEVYVSFVVPAYNEESRLPRMLNETLPYLQARQSQDPSFTWEVVIVDDGSKDRTAEVVLRYASTNPEIRLLKQPFNMGKGAAIQAGSLHSRGRLILMVDADGATKISEFEALERKILECQERNKEAIVVGSRAHLEGGASKAQRTAIRNFLGLGFHLLIAMTGVRGIKDTQCGFKLFSREAARWLFPNQHIQRWCFDVELLLIGKKKRMPVAEVPVEWKIGRAHV
jgi:dolichyl-phosphate beta-glucosyltransferase